MSNTQTTQLTPGSPASLPRLWLFRHRALTAFLAFVIIVLLGFWFIGVFGGNERTVSPGLLYRSAQLTGSNLRTDLQEHHIRTVINLRGPETTDSWYHNETSVCHQLGVTHVDIALSASHAPPPAQMIKLLHTFDSDPYPMLLHCMGGSDRSGLASALYLNVYKHVPIKEAVKEQLCLRYGHIRWGPAHPMDDFFTLYEHTSGGLDLRQWLMKKYPAIYRTEYPQ